MDSDATPGRAERSVFPGFADLSRSPGELIDLLVARRRALGLSQTDVAAAMGTSQSAVARLERGDADVRLSTLGRYAAALGQRLAWAAADTGEEDPS